MYYRTTIICLGTLLSVPALGVPVDVDFNRYQVILDRKPFGDVPPPSSNTPAQTVPQAESFAKMIRMSAILELDDGGMRVGLIDMSNNENFFLSEGEMVNGVELVSASWDDEEAVLRRGPEMAVIKLQSGEIQALTPAEQKERLENTKQNRLSYAERRRQRQERRRAPHPSRRRRLNRFSRGMSFKSTCKTTRWRSFDRDCPRCRFRSRRKWMTSWSPKAFCLQSSSPGHLYGRPSVICTTSVDSVDTPSVRNTVWVPSISAAK